MDIGIVTQLTDRSPSIVDVARAVEERGFESLWLGEHTHCPVDTVHRYTSGKYAAGAKTRGGYVPEFYKRMPDPYILLAAAAAATSTLRLGTSVGLPAEHNPLEMAKEVASLDLISGGRFEFGVGYGWSELEASNNGIPFNRRRDVMREKLLAMKALWAQETASFAGEYVNFTESWSWPKPVQRPNPPILLGAKLTARA